MNHPICVASWKRWVWIFFWLLLALPSIGAAQTRLTAGPIQFDHVLVDTNFLSEGAAVADIDKDGVNEILVGDYYYETPSKAFTGPWVRKAIHPPIGDNARLPNGYYNPERYSNCHGAFSGDFNNDGWVDQLVVPFHGNNPTWYENPKGNKTVTSWVPHDLGYRYGVEQSWFIDVNGSGKKSLVTSNLGANSWSYWTPDATGKFTETRISAAGQAYRAAIYSHGLGMVDINGDGKLDLAHGEGWYQQPAAGTGTWTFHADKFQPEAVDDHDGGNAPSHLLGYDFNGDGRMDFASGASHGPGVWWFKQLGPGSWQKIALNTTLWTNHAMTMADLDLDGKPDLIGGKRKWAHRGSPGDQEAASLFWIKTTPGATPKFDLHTIKASQAGVGTQVEVVDIDKNGYPDILVSSKNGIRLYLQVSRGPVPIPSRPRVDRRRPSLSPTRSAQGAVIFTDSRSGGGRPITADGRRLLPVFWNGLPPLP